MLAPCTLHFGPESISWECRRGDGSEECGFWSSSRYDTIRPKQDIRKILERDPIFKFPTYDLKVNGMTEEVLHVDRYWTPFVEYYTGCHLTYQRDVMVAINGIVRLISDTAQMRNVAGLWTDCIVSELLWFAHDRLPSQNDPNKRTHNAPTYLAPSWSWASLERQVNFAVHTSDTVRRDHRVGTALYTDVEVDLRAELVEAVSQGLLLHSAFIRVRSWIKKVRASETVNPPGFSDDRYAEPIQHFVPSCTTSK